MFKKAYNKIFKTAGFTLIELLLVIALLSIIAAIAIPKLSGAKTLAQNKVDEANASILTGIAHKILAETGSFPIWNTAFTNSNEIATPYLTEDIEIQNPANEFNYEFSTGTVTVSGSSGVVTPPVITQLPAPTVSVSGPPGNSTVTVNGTPGATAILRIKNHDPIEELIPPSATVQLFGINSNLLQDVILKKDGWLDSGPTPTP